ncbi:MAG: hypothetical protein ABSG78_08405 [Verrucomicrobiota bacterium]|jgi:hypothetical protein
MRLRAAGLVLLALAAAQAALQAQTTWQEELGKMPLTNRVAELNRSNCVAVMLGSFRRNPAVKGLIFMPGATDEFYFFRRARARLTNSSPTLLDAVAALTNQTYIRATVRAPFLLLHTAEDPLEPIEVVLDAKAADAARRHKFAREALYNDRDWDYMEHLLGFYLNTTMIPRPRSPDSNHFFRNSFVAFDLNGWEALEASALAGKTKFTVKKRSIVFEGDARELGKPPMDGFSLMPH